MVLDPCEKYYLCEVFEFPLQFVNQFPEIISGLLNSTAQLDIIQEYFRNDLKLNRNFWSPHQQSIQWDSQYFHHKLHSR